MRSGPGTAPRSDGGQGRRRGSSRSTRRRRRTRARRSGPGRRPRGSRTRRVTASATLARGAPGAPKTTRRPEPLSTQQTRRRPSKRAPERSISSCRRPSVRPLSGERASMAERRSAPPGAESAVATGASGDVAAQPQRAAVRSTPRRPSGSASAIGGAPGLGGRRSGLSAARRAATIAPADVPTKASTPRRSAPASSSMPASRPVIHASPITPPPARTSTSGATKAATASP